MLDLVTIYDIFTCKEMPYNNTLRSQRGAILFFVLFFFWLEKLIPELELAHLLLRRVTNSYVRRVFHVNGGTH